MAIRPNILQEEFPSFAKFFGLKTKEPKSPFEDHKTPDRMNTRMQKGFTGMLRHRQNLVPDMHRPDPSDINKVEILKTSVHRHIVLNKKDLQDIQDKYNIKNLTTDSPRELGTTGITIYFDNNLGSYCLRK